MISKNLVVALLVLIVGSATFVALNKASAQESLNGSVQTPLAVVSLQTIGEHASTKDCWTAIDGSVYDITGYISLHPGGGVIAQACGKDASELFATQGGEGAHSASARTILARYRIGPLEGAMQGTAAATKNDGSEGRTVTAVENSEDDDDEDDDGNDRESGDITMSTQQSSVVSEPTQNSLLAISSADVAKHTTSASCWVIVDGNVYDVTNFIDMHPGGASKIRSRCGKDISDDFHSVRAHATQNAQGTLDQYILGPLEGA